MTLTRQIIMIFVGTLLLFFIGTFFITVQHVKTYFESQLSSNAQDTATALGLTLSKHFEEDAGKAMVLAKVKAVFDRGYFSSIEVKDIQGNNIVKRFLRSQPTTAPSWFQSLVTIENDKKSALIMNGWQQVGKVVVESNSSLAYYSLWQTAMYLFLLFLILTLALSLLGALIIHILLKPLKLIIQQAKDIGQKKFYALNINPHVKELKDLSKTIDVMVEKLQKLFTDQLVETEELRIKAYVDSLTGLGNRRYFFQQLDDFLNTEEKYAPGYLIIIELSGLIDYNQKHGYHGGDQLLDAFSKVIKITLHDHHIRMTSRLEGPNFAFLLLDENPIPAPKLLHQLYCQLKETILSYDKKLSCSIAAARYRYGIQASHLMEHSDNLLQLAKEKKDELLYIQEPDAIEKKLTLIHSDEQISKAIENENFKIFKQPVRSEKALLHQETYIKLLTPVGEVPARIFLPIANKINLDYKIDEYMLTTILEQSSPNKAIAINLSTTVIHNKARREAFLNLLKKHSQAKKQILFEVSEEIIAQKKKTTLGFISELHHLGFKVGLDHVGASLLSFEHFKNSNISYLKLDGTLSKNLENSDYKQKMIKNLVNICENMETELIATQIESEAQWRVLKDIGIIWFQGNYIEKPSYF